MLLKPEGISQENYFAKAGQHFLGAQVATNKPGIDKHWHDITYSKKNKLKKIENQKSEKNV